MSPKVCQTRLDMWLGPSELVLVIVWIRAKSVNYVGRGVQPSFMFMSPAALVDLVEESERKQEPGCKINLATIVSIILPISTSTC